MDNQKDNGYSKVYVTGSALLPDKKETVRFLNRDFTRLPTIMMVEGAYYPYVDDVTSPTSLHFSKTALAKSVGTWNGRAVTIDHPPDQNSSCNSPEVYDNQWVGHIFNTTYDRDSCSLKSDIWLDVSRGKFLADLARKGAQIDVSIGASGNLRKYRGAEDYDLSFENIVGDHLAVLPGGQGACSWKDGCGIRAENNGGKCRKSSKLGKRCSIELVTGYPGEFLYLGGKPINNNKKEIIKGEVMATEEKVECAKVEPDRCACSSEPVKPSGPVKFDENVWLSQAPPAYRNAFINAMENFEVTKKESIDKIVACTSVPFDKNIKALGEVKSLALLGAMAELVGIAEGLGKVAIAAKKQAATAPKGAYNYQLSSGVGEEEQLDFAPLKDIKWDTV